LVYDIGIRILLFQRYISCGEAYEKNFVMGNMEAGLVPGEGKRTTIYIGVP